MYSSSSSQDYVYNPDAYLRQPARRNEVTPNYGHSQFMGSTRSNGAGMPHSYGNTPMAPPMMQDTAESLQRDFDRYMRDTAGSRAPFPSAHPYSQHPPTTVNPKDLYKDGHAPHARVGQQAISPPGKEPSTSTRSRSSPTKPYAKAAQPKGSRKSRKDEREFPAQLAAVMGPGPLEPTGYIVVPQGIFCCGATTYQPIEFMPLGWKRLGNKSMKRLETLHPVEESGDIVLSDLRDIVIKIQWPGYSHFIFEKRIVMDVNGEVTRGELAEVVCKAVAEFVKTLKLGRYNVKRELAEWMIGAKGFKIHSFFVPRLLHRGGNYFQPEIWVPSAREQ